MDGRRPSRCVLRRRGVHRDPGARIIARLAGIGSRLGGQPGQEFRARLRDNLLSAHDGGRHAAGERPAPVPASGPAPIRMPLLVRLRPAGLALAMVIVMFAASWSTHAAVPGDMLYPLKRASESALIGLSVDETARAERELVTARTRASEAAALAGYEDPERSELLAKTIDEMASTTRSAITTLSRVKRRGSGHGGDLRRFAAEQRNVVEPLLPTLKGSSKEKASAYLHLIEGFEAP